MRPAPPPLLTLTKNTLPYLQWIPYLFYIIIIKTDNRDIISIYCQKKKIGSHIIS